MLFLYRKPYTEDILRKCFEFDWEHNKLAKFIKKDEDREKIKSFLNDHYKQYLECYKYYASLQPIGDVWAVQQHPFTEFIDKIDAMDENVLEPDINLKWVSTLAGNPKNARMPERGLVR